MAYIGKQDLINIKNYYSVAKVILFKLNKLLNL